MTTTDVIEILHGGAERLAVTWVNADPPPVRISRYRVAPGKSVTMHVHTGKAELWVIVEGEGVVRVGDQSFAVRPGDVVHTPPSLPHGLTTTSTGALVFLNIVQPTGEGPITSTEVGA
jgi:mannose-6-phosphate isomerase-like protein (cupin superfamily)